MAKVFGVHETELRPGVKGEDFERFVANEASRIPLSKGWKVYLAKADRGTRDGKYALIFEIESVEARDHPAPRDGEITDFSEQQMARLAVVMEEWSKLASTPLDSPVFCDYVVLREIQGDM